MDGVLGENYGNAHKAFLQSILARGTITFAESKPILAAIFNVGKGDEASDLRPDQIQEEDFTNFLDRVGQVASLFDYEIRSAIDQKTRERVYALVNTAADPQTQLATTFSPDELSFIKRLLEAMFDKYNTPRMEIMALTSMQAMKLARPPQRTGNLEGGEEETLTQQSDKGLKHSEAEAVLGSLVASGWMGKSRQGFYHMSQRALLELRSWLLDTFNDPDAGANEWQRIKFCAACKDLITMGLRCSRPDCNFRLHDGCQEAFWKAQREKKCPRCSTEWTGKKFVGEKSVTTTEAYERGRGINGAGRRSTLGNGNTRPDDAQNHEEDGVDEEED